LPLLLLAAAATSCRTTGDTARLAAGQQALLPIVVGTNASAAVRATADTLADYLGRISGATFAVQTGDGSAGIVVGLPADFPGLPLPVSFSGGPFGREEYVLQSSGNGVWLLGATELAVEHAAWDLLYRLGYRQFFPGQTWEVIPTLDSLAINVAARESPNFYARRIWYNWGLWGYNNQPYAEWCARNRMAQGFQLNSGHAYETIVAANRATFDAHPEYLALVQGERQHGGNTKFCVANPGLRRLVVDWAVQQIKANPDLDSVSLEPSDGGGWCECEACAAMGSPSDRALTLANEAAAAINELGLGDKYVGMYAYNLHSPPPAIRVHPRVIISTTTAFLTGGYSLDQIIDGWQRQGATLGIYDYYSVIAWDWNLPGRARAARPAQLAQSIGTFFGKGARFYDCESGDAWGPYGLGYYIASRVMWNTNEISRVDALVEDFLTQAFGPAREPMRQFYQLINFDDTRRAGGDQVGRLYRALAEAQELARNQPAIRQRINQLILYTRYVELYHAFANAVGDAKAPARDAVISHVYRMRRTMMVHAYGFWARTIGQGAAHQADHPLKDERPFAATEIQAILEAGIAANQPIEMGFTPVAFSEDLVPARPLNLPAVPPGSFPTVPQDRQTWYLWVSSAPADVRLEITVQKVWALRPHRVSLFSPKAVDIKPVAESDIVRPDGQTHDVVLATVYDGLHRLEIVDGGDYTRIVWPEGTPVTLPCAIDSPSVTSHFRGGWSLYGYVPKGTKIVGGWAARIAQWAPRISGTLRDGEGKVVFDFGKMDGDGWFSVPVPPGQDGQLWKFENSQGTRQLMTIPPCLARNGDELLLPKEVVERDAPLRPLNRS
ncbi:DUF4838 domain-containing protein, partial [bacterium]|nr:DUF4838 domain-containing protein [bacterium]